MIVIRSENRPFYRRSSASIHQSPIQLACFVPQSAIRTIKVAFACATERLYAAALDAPYRRTSDRKPWHPGTSKTRRRSQIGERHPKAPSPPCTHQHRAYEITTAMLLTARPRAQSRSLHQTTLALLATQIPPEQMYTRRGPALWAMVRIYKTLNPADEHYQD